MKKKLTMALAALLAVCSVPTSAMALNTLKPAAVVLTNGYVNVPLGTWVTELNTYVDVNGYEACSYFVKWIDACFLRMTSNLFLDELVVPGYLDCGLNSITNFPTVIFNSPDYVSVGFDKFNQKRTISSVILSTDGTGLAFGIVSYATNFPYPIRVIDP